MKSTKEKIEVMQAYEDGETLQIMLLDKNPCWTDAIIKKKEPEFRWGEFDYRIKPQEPQTDWSKVAKGTAVLVRDNDDEEWQEAFFLRYDSTGDMYPFNALNGMCDWWDECKLDKTAPSIINWLPYKKEYVKGKTALVKDFYGKIRVCDGSLFTDIDEIEYYAIIE